MDAKKDGRISDRRLRRIMKEYEMIHTDDSFAKEGFYFHFKEDKCDEGIFLIEGPRDSVYEFGWYLFSFSYPKDYPIVPPKVKFLSNDPVHSIRFHPNLYETGGEDGGKVCLSLLGTWGNDWSPAIGWINILQAIKVLVMGLEHPLCGEPGLELNGTPPTENHLKFERLVRYKTLQFSALQQSIDAMTNPDSQLAPFKDIIMKRSRERLHDFKVFVVKYLRENSDGTELVSTNYSRSARINHETINGLMKRYIKLLKEEAPEAQAAADA